jgi:hypothetical protein
LRKVKTYLGESEKRIKYENKKIELKLRAKKREEARKAQETSEPPSSDGESMESNGNDDTSSVNEGDSDDQ